MMKCCVCGKEIKLPYISHNGDWYCCWDCWLVLHKVETTNFRGKIGVKK